MEDHDRRAMTFSQAEGLEPLPASLMLGEISSEARALIWNVIYQTLKVTAVQLNYHPFSYDIGSDWRSVQFTRWIHVFHRPADEFRDDLNYHLADTKQIVLHGAMHELFDFLTHAMRSFGAPKNLEQGLAWAFTKSRLAYRIDAKTIWPAVSAIEGEAVKKAYKDLSTSEYGGARSHLRSAADHLSRDDWAGSVRESIHAVEGVAKAIEPSASTLADALKRLVNSDRITANMKRALEQLYSYTNSEQGIRHAKVFEDKAKVDQTDAVFMLGACASFVSFLISRVSVS